MTALPLSIHAFIAVFVFAAPVAILFAAVVFFLLRSCGLAWRTLAPLATIGRWGILAPIPMIIWNAGALDMSVLLATWCLFLMFLSIGAMGEWAQEWANESPAQASAATAPVKQSLLPLRWRRSESLKVHA